MSLILRSDWLSPAAQRLRGRVQAGRRPLRLRELGGVAHCGNTATHERGERGLGASLLKTNRDHLSLVAPECDRGERVPAPAVKMK